MKKRHLPFPQFYVFPFAKMTIYDYFLIQNLWILCERFQVTWISQSSIELTDL